MGAEVDFDYSSGKGDVLDLVVRPGRRYGDAVGGQVVRVDVREYERQPTRDTLYTVDEHAAAIQGAIARREAAAAPKTNPVGEAIRSQLERLWGSATAEQRKGV